MRSRPDAARASAPTIGSVVLQPETQVDQFVIDELIAEGSTARVYRAQDEAGDPIALKVLRSELSRPREGVERFAAEARACVEVSAANLPRLIRNGRLADGSPYLALTYFDGPTLDGVLESRLLSVASVLQLGSELASALEEVHAHGFVHCQVQPSNVILARRMSSAGVLATGALIGFGTSRRLERSPRISVPPPPHMSLADYLAPEQLHGSSVGVRSDIFALGCVLYHALAGRPPARSAWHAPITPVSSLRPDCPPEVERAIGRALRQDPDFRWASARRFAEELSWLQARSGFGLMRRWQEEIGTGKHAIPKPPR